MHVRRKKESELIAEDRVVVDVTVGRLDPTSEKGQADKKWESRTAGIWVLRSSKPHAGDSKTAVTSVDVLFGDDAVEARDGWQLQGTPLLLDASSDVPAAHITVRRGSQVEIAKPQPRVNDNGRFKIMQLADIHLSTGVGHCRDAVPDEYEGGPCMADPRTLDFVSKLLDEERPDLVVLSGDQVNGDTAPDAQSVRSPWRSPISGYTDNRRLYLNMPSCLSSIRFLTCLSSGTMMMKGPYRGPARWPSSNNYHIRSQRLGQMISTA